jgi:UMF1 family MFS transporter
MSDRIGPKRTLYGGLSIYTFATVLGYFMTTEWQFFVLAFLVGMVQGGTQALSRSLFARMIPKHKSSEYFGFFSVFEKFAGIFGPALFAATVTIFGSSRSAILSVIVFFVVGGLVLTRVNVEEGEAQAAAANVGP